MKKYNIIVILALIALVNAAYLSYKAYLLTWGADPLIAPSFCDINALFSCTNALSNPATLVFGIPFPMIALVVYPIILILALIGIRKQSKKPAQILFWMSLGGIGFNGYIISQEYLFVHSYCILCLICTAIIISIHLLTWGILKSKKYN